MTFRLVAFIRSRQRWQPRELFIEERGKAVRGLSSPEPEAAIYKDAAKTYEERDLREFPRTLKAKL
jgi:hypothetical protein